MDGEEMAVCVCVCVCERGGAWILGSEMKDQKAQGGKTQEVREGEGWFVFCINRYNQGRRQQAAHSTDFVCIHMLSCSS